ASDRRGEEGCAGAHVAPRPQTREAGRDARGARGPRAARGGPRAGARRGRGVRVGWSSARLEAGVEELRVVEDPPVRGLVPENRLLETVEEARVAERVTGGEELPVREPVAAGY